MLGFEVVELHRTSFSGISLKGLSEGNWLELNEKEMEIIQTAVANAASVEGSIGDSNNLPRSSTANMIDHDDIE